MSTENNTPNVIGEYTDPSVFTAGVLEGWAETGTDPTRIDWTDRQARALIPFRVVEGRPVSPCPGATVRHGRNRLGLWGENAMADALVTLHDVRDGCLRVLLVERGDGLGWAVPGGKIEPGESPRQAAGRELTEETGLRVAWNRWQLSLPCFVPDPRGSDEAWAVTVLVSTYLGKFDLLPPVAGADDARRAEWVRADTYPTLVEALRSDYAGEVFPAHADMLRGCLPSTR